MKGSFFAASLLYPLLLISSESISLAPLEVSQKRVSLPTKPLDESVYTGSVLTPLALQMGGMKAKMSIYETLIPISGVSVSNADNTALSVEQGSTRVRGVRSYLGSTSVAGVPNYGINPIGAREYIYDTENIDSISIYKGAFGADKALGIGTRGANIELEPKWAGEKRESAISLSAGSNSFERGYVRFDSGLLGESKTALSLATSAAKADKWRGEGELGWRKNLNFTAKKEFDRGSFKLFVNRNSHDAHLYRAMSFAEISGKNLQKNYYRDFDSTKRGSASDVEYYKNNRGEYENSDFIGSFEYLFGGGTRLELKPYYSNEDSNIYQGNAATKKVQKRVRKSDRYGILVGATDSFLGANLSGGFGYEMGELDMYIQNYNPANGAFAGYGVFASGGKSYTLTPYLKLSSKKEELSWQLGIKRFLFRDSSLEGYTTNPTTLTLVRAEDFDRQQRSYSLFAPSAGVSYDLNEYLSVYASYSKSFVRPYAYLPLLNIYAQNRAAFRAAGIDANTLFKGYKLEESDNYELGFRWIGEGFDFINSIYYSKNKNQLITASDTRVISGGKPVSYGQNIGESTGYGLESELNLYPSSSTTVFVSGAWMRLGYDKNINIGGRVVDIKSKQSVDTPKFLLKSGASYRVGGFFGSIVAKYSEKRYADIEHKEKIGGYATFDASLSYKFKKLFANSDMKLSLDIYNITDKKYISVINASDDNRAGAASFYQGAPRSFVLTAEMKF